MTMEERCRREVVELHDFFQSWFEGRPDPTDASFERFAGVMAEGFRIVSPGGGCMARDEILDLVRDAHGSHRGKGFRLWIERYEGRLIDEGLLLATYEEWQETNGRRRGRLSSALLRSRPGLPNDVEWLHVHETWLP